MVRVSGGLLGCARALKRHLGASAAFCHQNKYTGSYFCSQALASSSPQPQQEKEDVSAVFRRKMEIAGVTPGDRIGVSVSGGAGSMALCLLALAWKRGASSANESSPVDGLTGFTTLESESEAIQVQNWLTKMGLDCEILNWPEGTPEAIRKCSRYNLLADACRRKNIGFLLTGSDADEQASQFLVRLSRCSGSPGLAVMMLLSDLYTRSSQAGLNKVLLVKPLLDIYRSDLIEICKAAGQEWIERPRTSVSNHVVLWPDTVRLEVLNLIGMFRKKRAELDSSRNKLITEIVVPNMEYGYVVLDAKKLQEIADKDIRHRILAAAIRFVRQRTKPRHRSINRCMMWIEKGPLEGEWFGAGVSCSLQPGTEASKVLVTASVEHPSTDPLARKSRPPEEANEADSSKPKKKKPLINTSEKYASLLQDARDANIISESTVSLLADLSKKIQDQRLAVREALDDVVDESNFEDGKILNFGDDLKETIALVPGKSSFHMQRFMMSWEQESECRKCGEGCSLKDKDQLQVRLLEEDDLETMEKIVKQGPSDDVSCRGVDESSMKEAWAKLKSLPRLVTLGLPVITTNENKLIGVPSVGFQVCPDAKLTSKFCPRIPLAGGTSVWM